MRLSFNYSAVRSPYFCSLCFVDALGGVDFDLWSRVATASILLASHLSLLLEGFSRASCRPNEVNTGELARRLNGWTSGCNPLQEVRLAESWALADPYWPGHQLSVYEVLQVPHRASQEASSFSLGE